MINKSDLKIVLVIFLLCVAVFSVQAWGFKSLEKVISEYSKNVGKEILFNGNIVRVIDYSMIYETYTLSNGVTVNKKIVEER
jgi:hypothetical protein